MQMKIGTFVSPKDDDHQLDSRNDQAAYLLKKSGAGILRTLYKGG